MLNVGGRPFLDTLIDEIARYNAFDEILLLAGDRAEHILARYAGAIRGRARLTVALLGTAGALAHAADLLQERFLLLNGSSFFAARKTCCPWHVRQPPNLSRPKNRSR
jgi:NDP-sugar pyrophosphorylase family protein